MAFARMMIVQGLWSFFFPACLGLLAAYLLVREVEYVQVTSDHDYYDDVPEHSERIVKRIMIGGGSLSFSIPHHPILLVTVQLIVGITVFQLVSTLLLVLAYNPGNNILQAGKRQSHKPHNERESLEPFFFLGFYSYLSIGDDPETPWSSNSSLKLYTQSNHH